MLDWKKYKAGIYRGKTESIRGVREVDPISLNDLIGIDRQKQTLLENTRSFLFGKSYNHALLWGARGMGKSALIKSMLNEFASDGLRLIEISRDDLRDLPYIVDSIRELEYKFIIFCDDLSFEKGDDSYKGLKPILEGSIEIAPKNVVVYASSNRRHLVSEINADNEGVHVSQREIHYSDAIEEKISLSDRFGLWISFYQGSFEDFLKIVDSYFKDFKGNTDELHKKAKEFANMRSSRSGRCAKQFYNFYKDLS
ncbi:MAG: ATP-binding protein [Proteobacteria bacterium]|nr:MAG: ATP-binding protein [Pseudomonadota bacterium]